jgi:LysM repeat protein
MKRGALVAFTLTLIMLIASACQLPYSQPPSVTNTPIDPNSLFATPLGSATQMSDVESFMTGTALALSGTPAADAVTQTAETPVGITPQDVTVTPTPLVSLNPTTTPTATLAVSGTLPTSVPVGSRPANYALQRGEFPYCIARRFDVNPDELLSLNGLSSGNIYYPNLTLKIPQTGSFPGTRALRTHPTTYTVTASDQTVYGVACVFGDVDPSAIAQANNISVGAALTSGQTLSIP